MLFSSAVWIKIGLSCVIAFAISFAATPVVKMFAKEVGAIDVPTEARRVHDHPIPRMLLPYSKNIAPIIISSSLSPLSR